MSSKLLEDELVEKNEDLTDAKLISSYRKKGYLNGFYTILSIAPIGLGVKLVHDNFHGLNSDTNYLATIVGGIITCAGAYMYNYFGITADDYFKEYNKLKNGKKI